MSKGNINKAGMQVVLKGGRGSKRVFNNKEVMKIIDLIMTGEKSNFELAETLIKSQNLEIEFCYHANAYLTVLELKCDTLESLIKDFETTLRILQNNFIGNTELIKSIKKSLEEYEEEFHIKDTERLILSEVIKSVEDEIHK